MKRTFRRTFAAILCAIAAGAFSTVAHGQITINIREFPKIKKKDAPDPSATQPTSTNTSSPSEETSASTRASDVCNDAVIEVLSDDMRKTLAQAMEYRPGLRDYYVQDFNDRRNEYLRAAISPSKRKEWYEGKKWDPAKRNCFEPLFNQIAEAAKKTLPTYAPPAYKAGTPAEFKVLRSGVTDLNQATVFRVGLEGPNWRIEKDSYNFPTARFKYGLIWAKYPNIDDGFCRIIWVNLVQDYAGGGTYGASYANFIKSEPAGCPPGK